MHQRPQELLPVFSAKGVIKSREGSGDSQTRIGCIRQKIRSHIVAASVSAARTPGTGAGSWAKPGSHLIKNLVEPWGFLLLNTPRSEGPLNDLTVERFARKPADGEGAGWAAVLLVHFVDH